MGLLEKIIKLGDPRLYERAKHVKLEEVPELTPFFDQMHETIQQFRAKYGAGRAIAAPQIGLPKRIICLNTDDHRVTMINPSLTEFSDEMFELWDDCMSFPNLLVRLKRHRSCVLTFCDPDWNQHSWQLKDDLSELLQHEYDHLEGILATQRALDLQSFKWR